MSRQDKLEKIKNAGINPYPSVNFLDRIPSHKALEAYGERVHIAGRIISIRNMGKSTFAHLKDESGKIQIYFKADVIKEYDFIIDTLDIGDIVSVKGEVFKTKTGEITVKVEEYRMLSKALSPLPEKWHGLKDPELRLKNKHLVWIMEDEAKNIIKTRSSVISAIREYFTQENFIEVETPVLQPVASGAYATPFKTFHNTYNIEVFLRIAPELYLKRMLVGGFEKIYEIGKVFRNEGVDTKHSPEFTMLEAYEAYTDYTKCMERVMDVINRASQITGKKLRANKLYLPDIFKKKFGVEMEKIIETGFVEFLKNYGINELNERKAFEHIVEEMLLPELDGCVFLYGYPSKFSPLAKKFENNELIAERFEVYIDGIEVANAYSELNSPLEQENNFKTLNMNYDTDFIETLKSGMPPAGGIGIGIDRLIATLISNGNIKEVLSFILLKP